MQIEATVSVMQVRRVLLNNVSEDISIKDLQQLAVKQWEDGVPLPTQPPVVTTWRVMP